MKALRRLLTRLGGMPASPWLGRRVFAPLDAALHESSLAPSRLSSMPLSFLTTTGRRTGTPRSVPLWHVPLDGAEGVAVIASNFGGPSHPGWAHNLDAHPVATLEHDGSVRSVRARLATADEFAHYWPRFVDLWPHYQRYRDHTDRNLRIYLLEASP